MDEPIVDAQTREEGTQETQGFPERAKTNFPELTRKLSDLERRLIAEKNIRCFEREALIMGVRPDRISAMVKISGVEEADAELEQGKIRQMVSALIKDFPEMFQKPKPIQTDQLPIFSSTPVKSRDPMEILRAMREGH